MRGSQSRYCGIIPDTSTTLHGVTSKKDSNLHTEFIPEFFIALPVSPAFPSALCCLIRDGHAWECHVKPHVSRPAAYVRCREQTGHGLLNTGKPGRRESPFDRLIFHCTEEFVTTKMRTGIRMTKNPKEYFISTCTWSPEGLTIRTSFNCFDLSSR